MKTWKKVLCLALAALMLVSVFAGCGPKNGNGDNENQNQNQNQPGSNTAGNDTPNNGGETAQPEYTFTSKYSQVKLDGITYIGNLAQVGDRLYFTTDVQSPVAVLEEDGPVETATEAEGTEDAGPTADGDIIDVVPDDYEEYSYHTALFSMKTDGTDLRELTGYKQLEIPEGWQGYPYIQNFIAFNDGVGVIETVETYRYNLPENFDPANDYEWNYYEQGESQWYLRRLDDDGNEVSSIRIDQLYEQPDNPDGYSWFYVNNSAVDKDGNIALFFDQNVMVLNPAGEKLFQLTLDNYVSSVFTDKSGNIAFFTESWNEENGSSDYQMTTIDVAGKKLSDPVSVETDYVYRIYSAPADSDYEFYYLRNYSLFGMKKNGDEYEGEEIFNFINVDVDSSNVRALVAKGGDTFDALSITWGDDGNQTCEINTIYKCLTSELPKKTTFTYACMYVDYNIRRRIITFNKQSDKYRIEVKDYSQYNTEDDYEAGQTKLTTEILSGQVPDLFAVDQMPISRIAAKGYLEDLWPFIDKDTELGGRSGVVEPIFNAIAKNGKLYYIVSSAQIMTVGGPAQLVGSKMGWTLADLKAAYDQMPPGADIFSIGYTKENVLRDFLVMLEDDFINWETGEVTFDSQEFIDVLNFADMFPAEFDWESYYGPDFNWDVDYEDDATRIASGKQMLSIVNVNDFVYWRQYQTYFGGDMTFIGYPTGDGSLGSAFSVDGGIAMSSTCKDKDGAWEFLRYLLTEEYQTQNSWSIPTNKKVFQQRLKEAMTPQYYTDYETGEQVKQPTTWVYINGEEIQLYELTQEDARKLQDLINATEHIYTYDSTVYDVVSDECAAFFAGQSSAENTAKMIQSRMNIYVNEKR